MRKIAVLIAYRLGIGVLDDILRGIEALERHFSAKSEQVIVVAGEFGVERECYVVYFGMIGYF